MMVDNLTYEDGILKLSGTTLPGIFKSTSVGSSLRWDDVKKENSPSGSEKIPRGWEDADISYSAVLTNDEESDPYKKLKKLNTVFRKKSNKAPVVYRVLNKHLKARGISKVYFASLSSREGNIQDTIDVTITFKEYVQKASKSTKQKPTTVSKKNTEKIDSSFQETFWEQRARKNAGS